MGATTGRDQRISEEMIDATLADSFPASDPPSWTLGRDHSREDKPSGAANTETSNTDNKEGLFRKPNIDLSKEQRAGVVKILNAMLSDEYLLYTKTRNYHWNVTGPQFHDLHKFFEEQYTELNEIVDEVAERARTLAGWYPKSSEMIANLLADHEAIIRQLRSDLETCADKYHDIGTSDFLTGLMEQHEKMAWMLRAFLEDESV
jgi:starvation-inducible DNA-binding protein